MELNPSQFNPVRATLFTPQPYFPQRGADKGPSMGVQGKLFRDPKPVDAVRYPRGYTPERMREVRAAPLGIVSGPARPGRLFSGPGGEDQVRQALARSTMPMSHVQVQSYYRPERQRDPERQKQAASDNEGFVLHIRSESPEVGRHATGHFAAPSWQHYPVRFGEVHLGRDETPSRTAQTLMHEMGHSRSYSEMTEHSSRETPSKKGQEEAFADDYMMAHFRPDPRELRRAGAKGADSSRSTIAVPAPAYEYEGAFTSQKNYGGKTAHRAYMKARTTPIQKDRFRRGPTSHQMELGEDQRLYWNQRGELKSR